ncbi:MAG: hypothetical protein VCF24_26300, partial [Candidatus Latescibacterota bacterium]
MDPGRISDPSSMQSHDKSYATALTETFTLRRILVSGAVNGVVLLWLALDPRSALTIDQVDIAGLGNPHPFLQSTEIAADLAVPLLIGSHKRPDNPYQYERIEQFSEDTDYDHLDAVFWDLAAMVSDIRPTTATLLLRNYLMYLMAVWLFSALLSVYHGRQGDILHLHPHRPGRARSPAAPERSRHLCQPARHRADHGAQHRRRR